jgi:hypothetical protein
VKRCVVILALALAAGGYVTEPARGALLLTGTTRDQMIAPNPAVDGFVASIDVTVDGVHSPNKLTATHAWGPYYFIAAHEKDPTYQFNSITPGRDSSAPGLPITAIDLMPSTDFGIVTASVSVPGNTNPSYKIAGIATDRIGLADTVGATVYLRLANQAVLDFINQVTGSSITQAEIAAGNSIITAPAPDDHVWSAGLGVWGTPSTGLHLPDAQFGQWQGPVNPRGFEGRGFSNTLYFATDFLDDGGSAFGAMNGHGLNLDSGSPAVIIGVPEPSAAAVLALAALLSIRRRTRGGRL